MIDAGPRGFETAAEGCVAEASATFTQRRHKRISPMSFTRVLACLLFVAMIAACEATSDSATRKEQAVIMGTTFTITVEGPGGSRSAIRAAFDEIRRIDRLLSAYKEDSEISIVNRNAFAGPVRVGPDFLTVATACRLYFDLSGHAFDPTVFPLMRLWGFSRTADRVPTQEELKAEMRLVGFDKVVVDEHTQSVRFREDGMALDFGGIAKGYAVDRAIDVLRNRGVSSAIVDAGGNFYALGTPLDRPFWQAGIRHPVRLDEVIARLPVSDRGMATSGNYERFVEIGGKRYCHILDPRTGKPVQGVLSATVLAETAMSADALSTAVFVLGPENGIQLVERLPDVEGVLIFHETDDPDNFRILVSTGLKERLELLLPHY